MTTSPRPSSNPTASPRPSSNPTASPRPSSNPTAESTASPTAESTAPSTASQFAYTSYLRIAAIIGVVLIHVAGLTYGNQDVRYTGAWWVASVATFSTKWAVPTMIMVSGVLLLRPPVDRSPQVFFRRRLARVGVPLVVWNVVYITLTATILTSSVNPGRLLSRFLRGESYTGLYFFWLILGVYLITPLLWPVVESISTRGLVWVGALLVALPAVNLSTLRVIGALEGVRTPEGDPSLFTQFVPYIGFFVLGYALRDVIVRGTGRILALAALTLALCLELTWQVTGPFVFGLEASRWLNILIPVSYQGWVLGGAAVAMFVLVHSVAHPQSRWAQPQAARRARFAGDLTLGVYASHLVVLIVLMRIPGHHWPDGAKTLPQLVVFVTATLLGATVLTLVIKKVPLLRRSV